MVRKCLDGIFRLLLLFGICGGVLCFVPCLFKLRPQIVLSGSMEPEISVGSLAYINEEIPPEEIRESDIIAYQVGKSMRVLHRVTKVDAQEQTFQTKGDANREADLGAVEFSQYEGKEVFSLPYAGYVVNLIQSGHNIFWIVAVLGLLVFVDGIWKNGERRKKTCRKSIRK